MQPPPDATTNDATTTTNATQPTDLESRHGVEPEPARNTPWIRRGLRFSAVQAARFNSLYRASEGANANANAAPDRMEQSGTGGGGGPSRRKMGEEAQGDGEGEQGLVGIGRKRRGRSKTVVWKEEEGGVVAEINESEIRDDADDAQDLETPQDARNMAPKTYTWISLWFAITVPVIFWDAGYCFMRPRSFEGGDLHWIWKPYALYQNVDYVYGTEAYARGDGFASAQSLLNVVENVLNMLYLYMAHVTLSPVAPLVGFASATMTLSKTVLYWAQEYYCGGCAVGHNNAFDLFFLWIVPNGLWLLVPSLIIRRLWKDLSVDLRVANKVASGKTR